MWKAPISLDSRKNCFISVPIKWGIDYSKVHVIRIRQLGNENAKWVYATCIGDSSLSNSGTVVIGNHFARVNNLHHIKEAIFELVSDNIISLSTLIAQSCSEDDWELLEMNASQVQVELLNRIRVVWCGARIPVWLTENVYLTITVVNLEPKSIVGLLVPDTELHVAPPELKPMKDTHVENADDSIRSIIKQVAMQFQSKLLPQKIKNFQCNLKLKTYGICNEGDWDKMVTRHCAVPVQPYMAFLSSELCDTIKELNKLEWCIGQIKNMDRFAYFSVVFVEEKQQSTLSCNAVYLTELIISQLKLDVKQDVDLLLETTVAKKDLTNITLYALCEDYGIPNLENEIRLWLESMMGNNIGLVLYHGQYLRIPSLVKEKVNEVFVSLSAGTNYCILDKSNLEQFLQTFQIVKLDSTSLPKYFQQPCNEEPKLPFLDSNISMFSNLTMEGLNYLRVGLGLNTKSFVHSASGCHCGNVLITGLRGSGRTTLAQSLCMQLENSPNCVSWQYVDCSSLRGKKLETLRREWQLIFRKLLDCQPSILLLDDLDIIAGSPTNEHDTSLFSENWYSARIADLLWELLNSVPFVNQLVILATAANRKSLNSKLNHSGSKHLFTYELEIPPLDHNMKYEMLQHTLERKYGIDLKVELRDLKGITKKMDAYTATDIHCVVQRAVHLAIAESGSVEDFSLNIKHLEEGVKNHIPFALHGVNVKTPSDSQKSWKDIGGLGHAKQILMETLKWPIQYSELFTRCPIRLRSAVMLYGPPGTGKTILASAVASECSVNFISIKGPELLSKFIGASEEAVRDTFRRARSAKPCILFFDEFDSLAPRRGHDSTGVTDRVVNQLLTEMDGVEGQERGLWILAATSRPDLIDPALLRPGRFDVAVHCPLPNQEERREILMALSSRMNLHEDINLEHFAQLTEHFSGADLQALLYTAQLKAIHQLEVEKEQPYQIRITQQHLLKAWQETRPSVSPSERHFYQKIYEHFHASRDSQRQSNQQPLGPQRATLA